MLFSTTNIVKGLSKYPDLALKCVQYDNGLHRRRSTCPIKTYVQDLVYTGLDKAYISFHGYEIFEDDRGVLYGRLEAP